MALESYASNGRFCQLHRDHLSPSYSLESIYLVVVKEEKTLLLSTLHARCVILPTLFNLEDVVIISELFS